MLKKKTITLIKVSLSNVSLVLMLYFFSGIAVHRLNGFIRQLPPHVLVPISHLDIRYNSFYMSGLSNHSIFLGNFTDPFILHEIDFDLKKNRTIELNWSGVNKISKAARIEIEPPFVFLKDGIESKMYRCALNNPKNVSIYQTPPFILSANLTNNSFVLRCLKNRTNVFVRHQLNSFNAKIDSGLLQKQGDGVFSTDGMITKIPESSKWVYMYYYRNQFFCVDSNLDLQYRGRTIDTVSHAKMKVILADAGHVITTASPLTFVNKSICANKKFLFINSLLPANNEDQQIHKKTSIIDVYYIENGHYKCSFYLPNFVEKKPSDIKVYNDTLVAIYGHYINTYKLNLN